MMNAEADQLADSLWIGRYIEVRLELGRKSSATCVAERIKLAAASDFHGVPLD